MEEAKSIALGGRSVYADQSILKLVDINDLGLECIDCGERVFYKDGFEKIAHFSHYPESDGREYDFCPIKQKNSSSNQGSSSAIHNRGQRLEIFQQKFLKIFAKDNPGFDKRDTFPKLSSQKFEELVSFLKSNLVSIMNTCLLASKASYIDDSEKDSELRERILIEAVDYLTISSSRATLQEIFQYVFFSRSGQKSSVKQLCELFCTSMGQVDWLQAFKEINDIYERNNSITFNSNRLYSTQISLYDSTSNVKQNLPARGGNIIFKISNLTREEYSRGCEREIKFDRIIVCKECNGSGLTNDELEISKVVKNCSCNKGRRSQEETLIVYIPRYWRQRTVPGYGNEGIHGGKNGDLIIKIENAYL